MKLTKEQQAAVVGAAQQHVNHSHFYFVAITRAVPGMGEAQYGPLLNAHETFKRDLNSDAFVAAIQAVADTL